MPGVDQSVPLVAIGGVESASKVDQSEFEPESNAATKGSCIFLECEKSPLFGSNAQLAVPFPMPVGERHTTDQ